MRLLLPYPIAILRLMLSYGPLPKLPGQKKRVPVAVVAVAVDDSLAERSKSANGLQYQKIRLLCSKGNLAVVAADDDVPVERTKSANLLQN